jgi:glutamate synthase domain-containing protein 1
MRRIIDSRRGLLGGMPDVPRGKSADEGGCGVVGFAASVPVRGRHIFEPSIQMHNRGNGKGGGIACACLDHEQLGVDEATLHDDYILQIALLDRGALEEVEAEFVIPGFRIDHKASIEPKANWKDLGLPIEPPGIVRYFVRARDEALQEFAEKNGLSDLSLRDVEDEFVYQNSVRLNQHYYASLGEKRAFVLSHARNLMIFKVVGYAEHVVQYYGLEDFQAQVWIAHQRYPTKGRVWHPAGSHPFIGMNEALVHNGDFANYYSVSEYLRQHNIAPQFLTDTEVSVLLFDLWSRVYKYPVEYVIEALAPTTELDFDRLPEEKSRIYREIQSLHIHGSPDGPWFFIIARSNPDDNLYHLLGITDTAMLRPQVFAIQEGDATIGLVASEKQAIDATLHSLSEEDPRFRPVADRYWNARGGSHTDGGAFSFTVAKNNGSCVVSCADKFGRSIIAPPGDYRVNHGSEPQAPAGAGELAAQLEADVREGDAHGAFGRIVAALQSWHLDQLRWLAREVKKIGEGGESASGWALAVLTLLNDRRYDCGGMRRSAVLEVVRAAVDDILDSVPSIASTGSGRFRRIEWESRDAMRPPRDEEVLVICGRDFQPEGDDSDARLAVQAYELGWKRFILYGLKGQRFQGCGFGPETSGVRIDVYGSSGDYLASGIDGMEVHVHNNGQDQLGQIMKSGCLAVYGDVGQAFMYGAKGGEVYVMGNAAGRPLINAVGRPRVVINGTCLDFLAESFMAGDPHKGGGFVVLNGIEFDDRGRVREQATPYPGSNLFSLASGGAIFVRDPAHRIVEEQLNGGEFAEFTDDDWNLVLPYLLRNEEFFGISVERDLLAVDSGQKSPGEVYRKVRAVRLAVLARQEVPE